MTSLTDRPLLRRRFGLWNGPRGFRDALLLYFGLSSRLRSGFRLGFALHSRDALLFGRWGRFDLGLLVGYDYHSWPAKAFDYAFTLGSIAAGSLKSQAAIGCRYDLRHAYLSEQRQTCQHGKLWYASEDVS